MYHYCNMFKLKTIKTNLEAMLDHEELLENYTHIWISDESHKRKEEITLYLSLRPFAIDSICQFRSSCVMEVYELNYGVHLWGIALKKRGCFAEMKVVSPRFISKNRMESRLVIDFQEDKEGYEEIYFIACSYCPAYGSNTEDNKIIPKNAFVVFEMKMKNFKSWSASQYDESIEEFKNLGMGIYTKSGKAFPSLMESKEEKSKSKENSVNDCKVKVVEKEKEKKGKRPIYLQDFNEVDQFQENCEIDVTFPEVNFEWFRASELFLINIKELYQEYEINERDLDVDSTNDKENQQILSHEEKQNRSTEDQMRIKKKYFFDEINKEHSKLIMEVLSSRGKSIESWENKEDFCFQCIGFFNLLYNNYEEYVMAFIFLNEAIKKLEPDDWTYFYYFVNQNIKDPLDDSLRSWVSNQKNFLFYYLEQYLFKNINKILLSESFRENRDLLTECRKEIGECLIQCLERVDDQLKEILLLDWIILFKGFSSVGRIISEHTKSLGERVTESSKENKIFNVDEKLKDDNYGENEKNKTTNLKENKFKLTDTDKTNKKNAVNLYISNLSEDHEVKSFINFSFNFPVRREHDVVFSPCFERNGIKFRLVYISNPKDKYQIEVVDEDQNVKIQESFNVAVEIDYDVYIQFIPTPEPDNQQVHYEEKHNQEPNQEPNQEETHTTSTHSEEPPKQYKTRIPQVKRFVCFKHLKQDKTIKTLVMHSNNEQLFRIDKRIIPFQPKDEEPYEEKYEIRFKFDKLYESLLNYYCLFLSEKVEMENSHFLDIKMKIRRYEDKGEIHYSDERVFDLVSKESDISKETYQTLLFNKNGLVKNDEDIESKTKSNLFEIDEESLKIVISSDLLEIHDEISLLLFLVEYYSQNFNRIEKKDPNSLRNIIETETMVNEYFEFIRYNFVPIEMLFEVCTRNPSLLESSKFKEILKRMLRIYSHLEKHEDNFSVEYRVNSKDIYFKPVNLEIMFGHEEFFKEIESMAFKKF